MCRPAGGIFRPEQQRTNHWGGNRGAARWHGKKSGQPEAFDAGYGIALIPFGISCLLIGYLVLRSTFLPRTLGVLMAIAGGAYLIFLRPALGARLFVPWIVVPAVVGEASLTLWLLIMGVNSARWNQQDQIARA